MAQNNRPFLILLALLANISILGSQYYADIYVIYIYFFLIFPLLLLSTFFSFSTFFIFVM